MCHLIGDILKRHTHVFRELFIKARGLRLKNSWPLSKIMFDAKFISGFHGGLYVVIQQTLVLYRVEHGQTLFLRLCCQGVLHLISRKFKPRKEEGSAELNALKQLKRAEVPIKERIVSHHIMWVTVNWVEMGGLYIVNTVQLSILEGFFLNPCTCGLI